jgi:histidinol phosphatase-like PHP family hydrolase
MCRLKRTASVIFIILIISCLFGGCNKNKTEEAEQLSQEAPGFVRGKVLTDSGEMVTAGIIVEDEAGNTYRTATNLLSGYNLELKPGKYILHFTRGFEYSVVDKEVTVESYVKYDMQDVRLVQLYDTYAKGWYAGDLHLHTNYSDGMDTVIEQLMGNISSGLYWVYLTDHNSAMGLSQWVQGNRIVANIDSSGNERYFHALEGVEETTEFGHYQSIGIGLTFDIYDVLLHDSERAKSKEEKDEIIKEKIIYIAESIRRNGGIPQINHPFSSSSMGFNYWDIAEHFDTLEIWNGVFVPGDGRYESEDKTLWEQNYRSKLKWFELLNNITAGGKFLPATGGTDNHSSASFYTYTEGADKTEIETMEDYKAAYAKNGLYNGIPTTYLHIAGEVNQASIQEAIRSGNSFISNGPILIAYIDQKSYGETVTVRNNSATLNIDAFERDGFEGIRIVKNGEIIQTIPVEGSTYKDSIVLKDLKKGDWIVLEVLGASTHYCITNPIFITE